MLLVEKSNGTETSLLMRNRRHGIVNEDVHDEPLFTNRCYDKHDNLQFGNLPQCRFSNNFVAILILFPKLRKIPPCQLEMDVVVQMTTRCMSILARNGRHKGNPNTRNELTQTTQTTQKNTDTNTCKNCGRTVHWAKMLETK